MRISIEVDEAVVKEVMAMTGDKRKSPALSKAILDYVRRRKAKEFGKKIRESAFDYPSDYVPEDPILTAEPIG